MKVRILSGNQAGAVVEQDRPVAESNIAFGFAEAFVEEAPAPKAPKPVKKHVPATLTAFGFSPASQADGFGEENDEK